MRYRAGGASYCWGNNSTYGTGMLGLGDTVNRAFPSALTSPDPENQFRSFRLVETIRVQSRLLTPSIAGVGIRKDK